MPTRFRDLSVKARLFSAIVTLCVVTLVISGVSLLMLRNAENWLDRIHQETLAEVSQALELSRNAADLATAAPFLLTVQMPFQRQADAAEILRTIDRMDDLSSGRDELDLPLSRIRVAIDRLLGLSSPQGELDAQIAQGDADLTRLLDRYAQRADRERANLDDRLSWAALNRLANEARNMTRAQGILEVGELNRRYNKSRAAMPRTEIVAQGLLEIEAVLTRQPEDLFQLKYRSLTAALDAENALFRIKQLSGDISDYATRRVQDAQDRLSLAQMQTSRDLGIAQTGVAVLGLFSLCIAVMSALFVSRYVTRNLRRIADGMHRLASGDHTATLSDQGMSHDEIGQLFHAFGVFRANARKLVRRTAQIKRQNAMFASVFSNIKDGAAILSSTGVIEAENDKVRALLHLSPGAGSGPQTMQDLFAASSFVLQSSEDERGGFEEYTNPAGEVIEVRKSDLPDGRAVWLLSEATERKLIDDRLEEIRRVETLGKVTGEVAHDFGNILSTISGNLHLLDPIDPATAPIHLGRIRTAVDLGVSLTERLVAFARKQQLDSERVEIGSLIEGMMDLLDIALPQSVTLHLDLGETPQYAILDPGQLESALLNVCMNAGQAITGSGNIWITLGAENDQVVLSVRDDGAGMDEKTRRRASDPFFTARPDGEGTGLGLSMVYGFVTQSGGTMVIRSVLGRGTEITIRFPASRQVPDKEVGQRLAGRALVVDDDPASAKHLRGLLSAMGYAADCATSFSQARDIVDQTPDFALIVSDLNLDHGQSGLHLIQTVLRRDASARAVLMSSRLPDEAMLTEPYKDRIAMLEKPVTSAVLFEKASGLGRT
ncbi:Blue-light-activated protein [Flavimaricola marinus]|uniref:histidine kinase n=2 Tax=Flavimaricola marinus TaxID=1819565 RepID=A0A238LBK3_9RHOB|nr:Blue-light-activated protein [Flavimaricola marinus]